MFTWQKKLSYARQEDIFAQLSQQAIGRDHFFHRELITVKQTDFEKYSEYFCQPVKIANKVNYRSNRYCKHIHAVSDGKKVQIHFDYGNPYKSILLGLVHLLRGVIPYFVWHLLKWKRPYSF